MRSIVYVLQLSNIGVLGVFNSAHTAGNEAVHYFDEDDRAELLRGLRHRAAEFEALIFGKQKHISLFSKDKRIAAHIIRMEVQ